MRDSQKPNSIRSCNEAIMGQAHYPFYLDIILSCSRSTYNSQLLHTDVSLLDVLDSVINALLHLGVIVKDRSFLQVYGYPIPINVL